MSQKAIQQENSQKPVFLSQGQVKPQSQANASQTSRVASQGQVLTQGATVLHENVLSQNGVSSQVKGASSQPVVPKLSQFSSQKSVSAQSQGCVPSQNQSQLDEKENIDQSEIDFAKAEYSRALQRFPSQNSQNLKNSSCNEIVLDDKKSINPKTDE